MDEANIKNILYSAQKNNQNNFASKNFISNLNKKYPSFPKKKQNNAIKSKSKSSINDINMNMNNIKNVQTNLNEKEEANTYLINSKNNRKIIYINPGMTELNNNKNNINLKFRQKMNNEKKKFVRNLSGENNNINIGYTSNNNQRSSTKKESSFINKLLYIKNSNLFQQGNVYANNKIKYNDNFSKDKEKYKNYKETLSKSGFNDNKSNNNSTNKQLKQGSNIKYIIPNKAKYKDNTNSNNQNNIKIDNLKKYIRKTEKIFQKKNKSKNELQLNNNFLIKGKTNSTPNDDINFIFTNPNNNIPMKNNKNKNYIVRNSLIYEQNEDINNKKRTSNNNYIVNVNKYINIINKKNKIINKNNNIGNNGINIYNYNSYKIINNTNNINNKQKKNNNYIDSPDGYYIKKYKSINKNTYISNAYSKYEGEFNSNKINFENIILKNNNFRTNTNTNPNQNDNSNDNIIGFKKLRTINHINKNIEKNENIYENKLLKNQRLKRYESELKNSNMDSSSLVYFNKNNNTNSTFLRGINNSYNSKNNKYANSRIYCESYSSSTKNLDSSQRNTYNYNPNINNKISISVNNNNNIDNRHISNNNDIDRNTNYKKGRNEKNNLGIIFKPQTLGQKPEIKSKKNLNSNRNPKLKNTKTNSETNHFGLINQLNNNSKNINFIKLMKTVNDYKNKSYNKQKYEKYINLDKNDKNTNQKKHIKFSYNPEFNNMNMNTFSEKKIIQNINQNTLTMYSIYIISYYFMDFNKIGLSKILILDKNKKSIPVICSNNNCGTDSNKLFSISTNNKKTAFITEYKKNIYINFYINNIHINDIKYIQITNYVDIKNRVSPVGKIEIYQGKKLIFKGNLNSTKVSNIEIMNDKKSIDNNDNKEIEELNEVMTMNNINNNYPNNSRPYSISRYRSIEDENMNLQRNRYNLNNYYDNYYTTRLPVENTYNNLIKNYSNDKLTYNTILLDNADNIEITDLDYNIKNNNNDQENNINNSIKNNINLDLDNAFSQKLSWEFSKSNKLNNIILSSYKNTNENYETYNSNNGKNNSIKKSINSNSNKNMNKTDKSNITLNNNKDIHNTFFNLFRKAHNKSEINEINQIFKKSINKVKDYSSFNLNNKIDFNNDNNNNNNNEQLDEYNVDHIDNDSFNELNFNNEDMNHNNNIYNSMESSNYIEFNKIRLVITSNYGHPKYVGLTGIELFNVKSEQINIESALTIGALPKDLRTLYNDEKEQRIFENVFNKINNTNDFENMWVTRLKKNYDFPFVELYFKEKLRVSKIKIYNYNEKDKLNIGAKTIKLYLDDEYYNTIYLKQGTGEIAFDFVKNDNNKYKSNIYEIEESEIIDNEDFGQEIFFPIKEIKNETESVINNNKMKYASFLYKQCYETPYLPSGYYLKFVLLSNYYKGIAPIEEIDLLKYTDIGFNKIEIYDEEGKNIIKNEKYKIISNSEIFHNDDQSNNKERIIINGAQNENGNSCLFYLFDIPKRISYIKFYPLEENNKPVLNTVKEIKIFCDCNIIFEGNLHQEKPTVVLFTCEKKIVGNINENYLTDEINERNYKEEINDRYISLVLN